MTLLGSSALNGTGNALNNVVVGNSGYNILTGLAVDDYLDGGMGDDALIGGTGDDTYVIDNTSDSISENASEGTDTVCAAFTYTLLVSAENSIQLSELMESAMIG
jgi:serralysin